MVEQVVGLRFVVEGEREATQALKQFSKQNDAVGTSMGRVASKVSSISKDWSRLNNLYDRQVIGLTSLSDAHEKLVAQLVELTGVTATQARDTLALSAAQERAAKAEQQAIRDYANARRMANEENRRFDSERRAAAARAAQIEREAAKAARDTARAAEEQARAQRNLEGSILRQSQAVNQAVRRLDELNRLKESGAVGSRNMAQAEIEIARALARTNGYLKSNGALNTQKALAEMRAAQAAREAAAAEAAATAQRNRAQQSYNQLLAAINPTIAAQQRMRQAHETVRAALAAGIITRQQAAQSLRQYRNALREANLAGNRAALGMNRLGLVTQQAGYQVGDFFVQIQSGTNVMVALGQQLTQLVGVFAMISRTTRMIAIFSGIGIIVPILTAIGAAYMRTRSEADKFDSQLSDLEGTLNDLKTSIEIHEMTLDQMLQKYGRGYEIVRNFNTAVIELQIDQAKLRFDDLSSSVVSVADQLAAWPEEFAIIENEKALQRIKGTFGLVGDEAQNVANLFRQLTDAEDFENQSQILATIYDTLRSYDVPLEKIPTELKNAVSEAGILVRLVERLKVVMDQAAAASGQIGMTLGDPHALAGLTGAELLPEFPRGRPEKPTGRGRGGAGKDIFISRIAEIREMQPAIKQAQEDIENYNKEVALLDSALAKGLITQQEYNSYVDQAAEAYGQTSLAAKQYENVMLQMANTTSQAMSDAFMSIVDGTKSAKDAFSDMARIIIKKAFEMAVINPILNAIFGGVSGFTPLPAFGATAANGAAFQGGNVVPFANGGVVGGPTTFPMSGGRTGLMGEAGPEAIMPLKRGKDGKLGVVAEGGGAVTQNLVFNISANGDDSVKRIVQQQIPRIAEATKAAVVDAKRRGGAYGKAFA